MSDFQTRKDIWKTISTNGRSAGNIRRGVAVYGDVVGLQLDRGTVYDLSGKLALFSLGVRRVDDISPETTHVVAEKRTDGGFNLSEIHIHSARLKTPFIGDEGAFQTAAMSMGERAARVGWPISALIGRAPDSRRFYADEPGAVTRRCVAREIPAPTDTFWVNPADEQVSRNHLIVGDEGYREGPLSVMDISQNGTLVTTTEFVVRNIIDLATAK